MIVTNVSAIFSTTSLMLFLGAAYNVVSNFHSASTAHPTAAFGAWTDLISLTTLVFVSLPK